MVITSSRDETEILRIATTAVPSLSGSRVEAVYFDDGWRSVGSAGRPVDADALQDQFAALGRARGAVQVKHAHWA